MLNLSDRVLISRASVFHGKRVSISELGVFLLVEGGLIDTDLISLISNWMNCDSKGGNVFFLKA